MSTRNLKHLFRPESIAVFGASIRARSIGGLVMGNLLQGGFAGPILPVNPQHRAVAGVLAYPDIASLPLTPDMAVICPESTNAIIPAIEALGARGTRAAIVLTVGIPSLRKDMAEAAGRHEMRILGPSSLGLLVPGIGLNASFAHKPILAGKIAFVSQSGALCTAVLDWARPRGIGFSHFISLGGSTDVDFGDVLDYLGSDPTTRAILLYIESIHQRRNFMSAARAAARNKPVLVIKAGRGAEGARAAATHINALAGLDASFGPEYGAGSDAVFDAAIRRAGMLRVYTFEELFAAVETLAHARPARGERLAFVTNGGGLGVMGVDHLIQSGGKLAVLSEQTINRLDQILPSTWSRSNPVDIDDDAQAERYVAALRVLFEAEEVDATICMHAPSALSSSAEIADGVILVAQQYRNANLMTCWVGEEEVRAGRKRFVLAGIPSYDTPELAARAFMHLVEYRRNQVTLMETPPSASAEFTPKTASARHVVDFVQTSGRDMMTETEAKAVLAAYGIPTVETHIASTSETKMQDFTVQQMPQGAHELIIGVASDPVFGPVILLGHGGSAVEVIADNATALPPLNMALARELIERTRVFGQLKGSRNHPPVNLDALCLTLLQVSQIVIDIPEILELEINPLLVDAEGVLALEARIKIGPAHSLGKSSVDRLAIRPYPKELEEFIILADQRSVLLRPIRPEDEPNHHIFISCLTSEDRRFRFFGQVAVLPHTEMARLTQIDYDREMAFIATAVDLFGNYETLGVVRTITDTDNIVAEFAIVVRSDMSGHGIGLALLKKMINYCISRGTKIIVGQVLRDNTRMLHVMEKLGFSHRASLDNDVVEVIFNTKPQDDR